MRNSLNLLRFVDGSSSLHRVNPRAKVIGATLLLLVLSFDASWAAVGITWLLVLGGAVVADLPRTVAPQIPRLLWLGVGISLALARLAGGEPWGLGGVLLQIRLLVLSFGLFGLSLLLGWTTPVADLAVAGAWMIRPLRRLGLPVDDIAAGLVLAVRALPIVVDEFTTVIRLSRFRRRREANPIFRGMDLAATAATATLRRAHHMGEAIEARGGAPDADAVVRTPSVPNSWGSLELGLAVYVVLAVGAVLFR